MAKKKPKIAWAVYDENGDFVAAFRSRSMARQFKTEEGEIVCRIKHKFEKA